MVKKNENGYEIKTWVALLTIVLMMVSITYSIIMTIGFNPLKEKVSKNEMTNVEQNKEINKIKIDVNLNTNNYEHIQKSLDEIKELLKK